MIDPNLTPVKISALPAVAAPSTSSKIPLVDSDNITKYATLADILAIFSSGGSWTSSALPAVSSVTALGNRSYNITYASTVAAILTPGMRLRFTKTVASPTQCTDLESGSSQYYSRASAGLTGITFTDDFVVSAWVKLESYTSGVIASRYNGTSGWYMFSGSAGQIALVGANAAAGNFSQVLSYQSIPLGKWVHIAAQLDMSSFTATTTTSYIMIDGVDVPSAVSRGGTNPTALVQAGNLEIGSYNGGTLPFDGKLAQVFVSSAKITQANVRLLISQGLTAALITTHSIASAYSFDNSISDLNTTNANNLTANGAAVATNADSPFGLDANNVPNSSYDWGIVTKVATTVATVQVPEGCTIPTSGGITTVDLSIGRSPFGMPIATSRWLVSSILFTDINNGAATADTWYNVGSWKLNIPIGSWSISVSAVMQNTSGASNAKGVKLSINTTAASATGLLSSDTGGHHWANAVTEIRGYGVLATSKDITTATDYYVNIMAVQNAATGLYILGTTASTNFSVVPTLL